MVSILVIFLFGIFSAQLGLAAPTLENEDMQSLLSEGTPEEIMAALNFQTAQKFSDETLSKDSIEQGIRVDSITDIQRIPQLIEEKKLDAETLELTSDLQSNFLLTIQRENDSVASEASSSASTLEWSSDPTLNITVAEPALKTEIEDQELLAPVMVVDQELDIIGPVIPEDNFEEVFKSSPLPEPPLPDTPVNDTRVRKTVKKDLSADFEINKILDPNSFFQQQDSHPQHSEEVKDVPRQNDSVNATPPEDIVAKAENIMKKIVELHEILEDLRQLRTIQDAVAERLAMVKSKFETLKDTVHSDEHSKNIFMATEKLLGSSNLGELYSVKTSDEAEKDFPLKDFVSPGTLHIEEVLSLATEIPYPALSNIEDPKPKTMPISFQMSILPVGENSTVTGYNSSHKLNGPANKPFYILLGPFDASNGSISASKANNSHQLPDSLTDQVVYIDPQEGTKPIPMLSLQDAWSQLNRIEHLE